MFEQAFKNIDDVLWKEAGCTTELAFLFLQHFIKMLKAGGYGERLRAGEYSGLL
jgi:type I restriction enzyme M protein